MPIQFHCRSCKGWIEVDDEHAGAQAVCPFCQAVNGVPKRSEPAIEAGASGQDADAGVPAEPAPGRADEEAVGSLSSQHEPAATPPRDLERDEGRWDAVPARTPALAGGWLSKLGIIGLVLAVLSIVMMATPTVIALANLPASLKQQLWHAESGSPDQVRQLQKQAMQEAIAFVQAHPWLGVLSFVGLLLWILSLVANLSALFSAGAHRRTYAWVGLGVNTLVLFACLCSSIMQRLAGT
jgi:hypothetical protein